jgi:hypothetical protein
LPPNTGDKGQKSLQCGLLRYTETQDLENVSVRIGDFHFPWTRI